MSAKDNISVISYTRPKGSGDLQIPRLYHLRKNRLKFGLFIFPTIAGLSLLAMLGTIAYFSQIKERIKEQRPVIIAQLEGEISNLNEKINDLEAHSADLTSRLATGSDIEVIGLGQIGLIRPIPGMQDLTQKKLLDIENIEVQKQGTRLVLNFNVINTTPEGERLSGYLFAFFTHSNSLQVYPRLAERQAGVFEMAFTSGESFATQRFRPFEDISFQVLTNQIGQGDLKILVFSRMGDLLYLDNFPLRF